jgi:hypothetical protein
MWKIEKSRLLEASAFCVHHDLLNPGKGREFKDVPEDQREREIEIR